MKNLKKNIDIIFFCILHFTIFFFLITGVKYFPLDLPTVMMLNKAYGLGGIFSAPSTTGRYWPLSQFISSLVTQLFGNNVLFQWTVQYLLFIVMTLLVWRIAWLLCQNRNVAFGAVVLCICVTPMSENVFTIGKPEITLSVAILSCLLFLCDILLNNKRNGGSYIFFCFFSFLSFISKETSVILLPVMILVGVYVFCFLPDQKDKRKAITLLILECFSTYLIYCIIKYLIVKDDSYTAYEIKISMILEGVRYYLKYCWDIILIGFISLISCIRNLYIQKKSVHNQEEINRVALSAILNVGGWGYLMGICLWRFHMVYYAFPSVIFFAGSFAVSLQLIKNKKKKVMAYWGIPVTIALIYGGWNGYLVSAATRDVSSMFSESIDFMLWNEQITGKIYTENYTFFEESPYQMNVLFELYGKDLEVIGIKEWIDQTPPDDETLGLYGYTKDEYLERACHDGLHIGDYVLLYENKRNNWLPCRKTNPSHEGEEKLEQFGLVLERIAGNQIKRSGGLLSLTGIRKVDEVTGWGVYRVIGTRNGISLQTEWEDWLGETNTVIFVDDENCTQIVLKGAYEHPFSNLDVSCQTDGKTLPCKLIIDKEESRYQLIIDTKDIVGNDFKVEICFSNSFMPSQFWLNSNDHRKLTLRIPDTLYMVN